MKILILNPHINAEHKLSEFLGSQGFGVLYPLNALEAEQLFGLHENIDLVMIHREDVSGMGEPGLELMNRLRSNAQLSKLVFLVSSEKWSEEECSDLQEKSKLSGEKISYIHYPFSEQQLLSAILPQNSSDPRDGTLSGRILSDTTVSIVEAFAPSGSLGEFLDLDMPPGSVNLLPSDEPLHKADEDPLTEMPYLLSGTKKGDAWLQFAEPVGNAIVPGGAASPPDTETLKKYLLFREQDVAVLSAQLKTAQEQILSLEQTGKEERAKSSELTHLVNENEKKIQDFEQERVTGIEKYTQEIQALKSELKLKIEYAKAMDGQVTSLSEEILRIKDRVRSDIRRIRVREKDLEVKLEILKKDSEALMDSRENKIRELKRKIDLLEFNMELLQSQYSKEKVASASLQTKLSQVAQAMKMAGGLLDFPNKDG